MSDPVRLQRRRTRGWRLPEHTKVVGRGSRFGNRWRVSGGGFEGRFTVWRQGEDAPIILGRGLAVWDAHRLAVETFEHDLKLGLLDFTIADVVAELRGWNLACWCALTMPCHADVLLKYANTEELSWRN